jgi:CHAT domain-containing protein
VLAETVQAAGPGQTPVLRIHTQSSNEWIPWEVLGDGTDLLGFRFKIARIPIVPHILEAANNQPHQVRNISNFLGRDVLDPAQRQEWESTFTGLLNPPAVEQLFPAQGDAVNFPDLQLVSQNYQNADIVHVMCHGMKEQETVYLTLNHRSTPTSSILFNITPSTLNSFVFRSRPLVFGNGCTSSGAMGGNQTTIGLMPPGIGASFFSRGALNFVGTFAPVTKKMALEFARKFYEHLLGQNGQPGLPIAEALWATKQHFRQANATDPSYLFYCLYGPPDTTYQA